MKQAIYSLVIFFLGTLSTFAQPGDTSFFPTGKIRQIKVPDGNKIVKATAFKDNGEVKYSWDMKTKTLESFDAISYEDTLAEYFKNNSPEYIIYQHYGNGPLMEIVHYKDNMRHGPYERFAQDGRIIAKGQFAEWKKVGIWTYYDVEGNSNRSIHWFNHNYEDSGISINYTVMPILITLVLLTGILFLFLRQSTFASYYVWYSLFTIGIFGTLFLMNLTLNEQTLYGIGYHIGKYMFPILTTFVTVMSLISLTALILKGKTGVKRQLSIPFLIISLGLGYLLLVAYIGSQMTGIIM